MKVQVWGCIRKFRTNDREEPYYIEKASVGVESVRVVSDINVNKGKIVTERILRITIVSETDEGVVSPIWLTFDSIEEAEELLKHIIEAIKAFKEDSDYEGGVTPPEWVIQ